MKAPDKDVIRAMASLTDDARFGRVTDWLAAALAQEDSLLRTAQEEWDLRQHQGAAQVLSRIVREIAGSREAVTKF